MTARNFIQWKGTDVCIDLDCECGHSDHFDGFFLYAWRCPACSRVYEMASSVGMTETADYHGEPVDLVEQDP